MKTCVRCDKNKPVDAFPKNSKMRSGYESRCKACKKDAENYNRTRRRTYKLKSKYGITDSVYTNQLLLQGMVCAICKKQDSKGISLSIDHDHSCCKDKITCGGKCLRGLVCWRCNLVLGYALDEVERLRAAADYLERYKNGVAHR